MSNRAKRKADVAVEIQIVATGSTSENGATEPAAGFSATKKVAVEKGKWSQQYSSGKPTFRRLCMTEAFHADAVFYTTDMRPAKLTTPADRILSWNVASLRSTLKKVRILSTSA